MCQSVFSLSVVCTCEEKYPFMKEKNNTSPSGLPEVSPLNILRKSEAVETSA